jgi:hypothetical protein
MRDPHFALSITSAGALTPATAGGAFAFNPIGSSHSGFTLICLVPAATVRRVDLSLWWEYAPWCIVTGVMVVSVASDSVWCSCLLVSWFRVVAFVVLLRGSRREGVRSECLSRNGWDVLRESGLLCSIFRAAAVASTPSRLCLFLLLAIKHARMFSST